ncbi:MAG: bacillithiol system redox-active protein YtxJ [Desulfosporosinus sp.]|nr:bacillithiol system redox-active protein YtxJ [Desulfosporosinus sp.]
MAEFKEITCSRELGEILDESCQRRIILFKHSTTCSISAHAWQEMQDFIRESSAEVLVVMIKVIESRPVCSQVTEDLGVKHQSPQVLLLSNRKVLWHASHQAVTKNNILKALEGEISPFNLSTL